MSGQEIVSILVVEDEIIVAMDLERRLKNLGYTVIGAVDSGEEAITFALEKQPDLVLMDIHLKGSVDGISAAEQIKNRLDIPIIYISAYTDGETLSRAKLTEPFGYLVKPFQERELYSTIEMSLYKARTEKQIKENEKLLITVFNSIQDALILTDLRGRIMKLNKRAVVLSGYEKEELIEKNIEELYLKIPEEEDNPGGNRYFLTDKNNRLVPVEITRSPLENKIESFGSVYVIRDITERLRYEEELIKAKLLAEDASRAKSEFLSTMSHELRTPLNGIIGMTDLSMEVSESSGELTEYLSLIRQSGYKLLSLINSILDLSRIEAGKTVLEEKDFLLLSVLEEAVEAQLMDANKKALELIFTSSLSWELKVSGDSNKISQILGNLIQNSIKFTEEGFVSVNAEGSLNDNKLYLSLRVKDTGTGIPEDKVGRIFDPFTQGDASYTRSHGGSGLGLSIVKKSLDILGGTIEVSSKPNYGSEFSVKLPVNYINGPVYGIYSFPEPVSVYILGKPGPAFESLSETLLSFGISVFIFYDLLDLRKALPEIINNTKSLFLLDCGKEKELVKVLKSLKDPAFFNRVVLIRYSRSLKSLFWEELEYPGKQIFLPIKKKILYDIIGAIFFTSVKADTEEHLSLIKGDSSCLRILLIDDNPTNQVITSQILEKRHHKTETANTGMEGLEKLKKDKYDLVLLDIYMPEMDGFSVVDKIRKSVGGGSSNNIPVIALTAQDDPGFKEKCIQAGMDGIIYKPIKASDFGKEIERIYREKLIKDTISDIIEEPKKTSAADESGTLKTLIHRARKAKTKDDFEAVLETAVKKRDRAAEEGNSELSQALFKLILACRSENIEKCERSCDSLESLLKSDYK